MTVKTGEGGGEQVSATEHGADVALLDDERALLVGDAVHGLHDLLHLPDLQVLEEVILQDRLTQEVLRSEKETHGM
ncbi:hypothetical protein E2C01_101582 [Portunus trituberculatus]|uniref:Uncharacterized protein n=1 Tax=Portunus trituberculatus TaxID=210409 RepID=A0A5B7KMA4_PORTR|nr:hypothetical protein [Portunus trituberculatus]